MHTIPYVGNHVRMCVVWPFVGTGTQTLAVRGCINMGRATDKGIGLDLDQLIKLRLVKSDNQEYVIHNVQEHCVAQDIFSDMKQSWKVDLDLLPGLSASDTNKDKLERMYYMVNQITIATSVHSLEAQHHGGQAGLAVPIPGPVPGIADTGGAATQKTRLLQQSL